MMRGRGRWFRTLTCALCVSLTLGPTVPYTTIAQQPSNSDRNPERYSLLEPVVNRVLTSDAAPVSDGRPAPTVPAEWRPWWREGVTRGLHDARDDRPVNLEHLLANALEFSEQIRVFRDVPLIRETAIDEAGGDFDPQTFADTNMIDTNTPVGSLLTTGGASRFHDLNWSAGGGVKQKNSLGGQFEVSQRFGYQNNNSTYFTPTQQGTARLTLRYTQPLLNGAGRSYNTSLITLAKIDAHAGHAELSAKLQEHLLEVTRAYWALYQQRAIFLQKARLLERSVELQTELESRARLDAVSSQLASARAAVAQRRTDLIRARAAILNAESRIRALVNSPLLNNGEIVPVEPPNAIYQPVDLQLAQMEALQFRPEVDQAARRVESAKWREYMAKVETKSQLNVVTEAYASGLRGDRDIGGSWVDQFSVGAPSYSAGLYYERPLNNTAAMARLRRRQLETRQSTAQMRAGAELMLWEVEVAAREVDTSWREMNAQFLAMQAAAEELAYREQRWRKLPGEQQDSASALEHLLDSQQRLTDAENRLAESQVVYSLSLLNLEKSKGTLLIAENITQERMQAACLPTLEHRKEGVSSDVLEQPAATPSETMPAGPPLNLQVAPPAEDLPAPPIGPANAAQANRSPASEPPAHATRQPNMAAPPSPVYVQAPFEPYAEQTALPKRQPVFEGPIRSAPEVSLPTGVPRGEVTNNEEGSGYQMPAAQVPAVQSPAVQVPATPAPAWQPPTIPPRMQPRRLPPVPSETPAPGSAYQDSMRPQAATAPPITPQFAPQVAKPPVVESLIVGESASESPRFIAESLGPVETPMPVESALDANRSLASEPIERESMQPATATPATTQPTATEPDGSETTPPIGASPLTAHTPTSEATPTMPVDDATPATALPRAEVARPMSPVAEPVPIVAGPTLSLPVDNSPASRSPSNTSAPNRNAGPAPRGTSIYTDSQADAPNPLSSAPPRATNSDRDCVDCDAAYPRSMRAGPRGDASVFRPTSQSPTRLPAKLPPIPFKLVRPKPLAEQPMAVGQASIGESTLNEPTLADPPRDEPSYVNRDSGANDEETVAREPVSGMGMSDDARTELGAELRSAVGVAESDSSTSRSTSRNESEGYEIDGEEVPQAPIRIDGLWVSPDHDPSLPAAEFEVTDPSAALDRDGATPRIASQNPLPSVTPYVLNPPRRDQIRPAQVPTIRIVHPEPKVRIEMSSDGSQAPLKSPAGGLIRMAEEPTSYPPGNAVEPARSTSSENPRTAQRLGGVVRPALPPRDFNSSLTPPPLDAVIVDRRSTSRPETGSSRPSRGPVTAAPRFFHEESR